MSPEPSSAGTYGVNAMLYTDTSLERAIDRTHRQIKLERDPKRQKALWDQMAGLIKQRSAARVAEMERERGLTQ